MAVQIQYRTQSIEMLETPDYWYEGDNEETYESVEDAIKRSDVVRSWTRNSASLTVVRVRDLETGRYTYISPHSSSLNA
jgi:hypothetical protein